MAGRPVPYVSHQTKPNPVQSCSVSSSAHTLATPYSCTRVGRGLRLHHAPAHVPRSRVRPGSRDAHETLLDRRPAPRRQSQHRARPKPSRIRIPSSRTAPCLPSTRTLTHTQSPCHAEPTDALHPSSHSLLAAQPRTTACTATACCAHRPRGTYVGVSLSSGPLAQGHARPLPIEPRARRRHETPLATLPPWSAGVLARPIWGSVIRRARRPRREAPRPWGAPPTRAVRDGDSGRRAAPRAARQSIWSRRIGPSCRRWATR